MPRRDFIARSPSGRRRCSMLPTCFETRSRTIDKALTGPGTVKKNTHAMPIQDTTGSRRCAPENNPHVRIQNESCMLSAELADAR